jgi:hypothetical protein
MNQTNFEFHLKLLKTLEIAEPYYIMSVILVGLISNSLTVLIFTFKKMKFEPANSALGSLALADNCFLLSLLVINLKYLSFDLFNNYQIICKLTNYMTLVSSSLSVW